MEWNAGWVHNTANVIKEINCSNVLLFWIEFHFVWLMQSIIAVSADIASSPVTLVSIVKFLFVSWRSIPFRQQAHLTKHEKADEIILFFVIFKTNHSYYYQIDDEKVENVYELTTYICTNFIHSMWYLMLWSFIARTKAFETQWKFPALLTLETDANDWRLLAIHTPDFVYNILWFFDAINQRQNIWVMRESNILFLPEVNKLAFR